MMIEQLLTPLLVLILASAWTFGFHVVMKYFVLLYILNWDIDNDWDKLGKWTKFVLKPAFACPYCMSSIHGSIIYFWFLGPIFSIEYEFTMWIPFCICLAGINYVIVTHEA